MLGVPAHRVAYLFVARKLPEPELRLGNRRVFSLADVQRVARALGRRVGGEGGPAGRPEAAPEEPNRLRVFSVRLSGNAEILGPGGAVVAWAADEGAARV